MKNIIFIISILNTFVDIMITFFLVYFTLIGLAGVVAVFKKRKYNETDDFKSFKFIICANNEELVIEDCIESIFAQKYIPSKTSILIINDNSIDNTELKIKKYSKFENIDILSRVSKNEGKQYALKYAFDFLKRKEDQSDFYVFLDADNILDSNYLKNLNKQIHFSSDVAIQSNVQVKNPDDNLLTNTIKYLVVTSAGMYFLGRKQLGLSTTLYGNGFAISRNVIERIPFKMESVTEDLEYSVLLLLNDVKIGYCHDSITYDEKPTNARVSTIQRERWMRGHFWVTKNYIYRIFKSIFNLKLVWSKIDYLIYLVFPFRTLVLVYLLYNPISALIFGPEGSSLIFKFEYTIIFFLIVSLVYNLMEIIIALKSGLNIWQITKAILYNQVHSIDWFIATQFGFFRSGNQLWGNSKTHHFRNVKK